MQEAAELKYRAFISYSHTDTSWARWLHRALESFRIDKDLAGRETTTGAIPDALRPIFRDRDEFSAGKPLTEQTLAALDSSHALIVLCSPASAKSDYVNEETRLFRARHPGRPVIPLIVGGKPGDPDLECFPPALNFRLDTDGRITAEPEEILAADAREEGDGKNLALAKVIAGLLDVSSDEIFRRAERERRAAARRRRRVRALVGALTLLLIAASIGWLNQDYLLDRYNWHAVMGPSLLTKAAERALKPGDTFTECRDHCPLMVVVPAGKFMMGTSDENAAVTQQPRHEVRLSKPFAVSKFEVTYDEWNACVKYGDCNPRIGDVDFVTGDQPVNNVTWNDARRYVAWLSRMTGKTYRLLSESEWEYAARAGTRTRYPWGDEIGQGNAHCYGCGGWTVTATAPRGRFPANKFGLHDMMGNVLEWVEDCVSDYKEAPVDGSAWEQSGCDQHVLRGGAWHDEPDRIGSAERFWSTLHLPLDGGIRVARTLDR